MLDSKHQKHYSKHPRGFPHNVAQQVAGDNAINNSLFRKKFRITGQVGEVGQKDKLSYISLKKQEETGLERGYSDKEVLNAAINAISPGLQVRSYLEGFGSITVPRLRKILCSHYKDGSATDLCQQLLTMSQNPNENPVNFLIRAMDCKQKILFACREETASGLKYSPGFLNGLFHRSVESGLAGDTIRMQLCSLLQDANIDDETLITEMQVAVFADAERKKVFSLSTRVKSINEISLAEKPSTKNTPKIADTLQQLSK